MTEGATSKFDTYFATLDVRGVGKITRAQAAPLFDKSGLPEETLAVTDPLSWLLGMAVGVLLLTRPLGDEKRRRVTLTLTSEPLKSPVFNTGAGVSSCARTPTTESTYSVRLLPKTDTGVPTLMPGDVSGAAVVVHRRD